MIRCVDRWTPPGAAPVNGLRLRHQPCPVNALPSLRSGATARETFRALIRLVPLAIGQDAHSRFGFSDRVACCRGVARFTRTASRRVTIGRLGRLLMVDPLACQGVVPRRRGIGALVD